MRAIRWRRFSTSALSPHQLLWAQGRPRDGLRMLREALGSSVPQDVGLKKELLDMLLGLSEYAEGIQVGNELEEAGALCADTAFQRGECKERLELTKEALDDYRLALAKDPLHVGALRRLARLCEAPHGVALLTQALDVVDQEDEDLADLFCERAVLYTRLTLLDDALKDYARCLQLNPKCAPAHAGKGDIHLMRRDYVAAAHNFERFMDLHARYYLKGNSVSGSGDAIMMDMCVKRCMCYAGLGDWEMVLETGKLALDLYHNAIGVAHRARVLYYMGRAHEAHGDMLEAMNAYTGAIDSGHPPRAALLQRSKLHRQSGMHALAEADEQQLEALLRSNAHSKQ